MEGEIKTIVKNSTLENSNPVKCETIADVSFIKIIDESIEPLLSDIIDAAEKSVEEIAIDCAVITSNACNNIKFDTEKDCLVVSSVCSNYIEIKKNENNSGTIPLYIQDDFVSSQAKTIDEEKIDFTKVKISKNETNDAVLLPINLSSVNESDESSPHCDYVIPDSRDFSNVMTKNDSIEHANINTSVAVHSYQCTTVSTSVCDYKLENKIDEYPKTTEIRNISNLAREQIESLSQKLSQTSLAQDEKNMENTEDRLLFLSQPSATECHELDKSEIISPNQNKYSSFQFSPDYKTSYTSVTEPCQYVLQDTQKFQPLLNCESSQSTAVAMVDKETTPENLTRKCDLDSCKTSTKYTTCRSCSVDQTNNMLVECSHCCKIFQSSEAQSAEFLLTAICHSCDCEINTTVSTVLQHILVQCDKISNNSCMNQNMDTDKLFQHYSTDDKCAVENYVKSKIITDYHKPSHPEVTTPNFEETNGQNQLENKENVDSFKDIITFLPLQNVYENGEILIHSPNKILSPVTELVPESNNTLSLEHNDFQSTANTIVVNENQNKLLEGETVLFKRNSNYPSIHNLQELSDNSNDLYNYDERELVFELKLTPDMSYQEPDTHLIIKDSDSLTEKCEKEEREPHFVPGDDQLVPNEETSPELIESGFYVNDEYEKNLRDVLRKNSNCLSENQCYKWRYTPSLGLGDIVVDVQPKTEGYADSLKNLPILKTCSRPIRIGLSRRQRAGRLHSIPWKK